MKYIKLIFRVLFGVFFIFSGIIKLYPIETFELTFVDLGVFSWKIAPFGARLLIAYEIILGVLITANIKITNVLKQSLGLLVFFTIYLIVLLIIKGDEGNCGCMGSYFYITPSESIIKNILLIIINIWLLKKATIFNFKYEKAVFVFFILASITIPFVLNPVQLTVDNLYDVELPYRIEYLNEIPKPIDNGTEINLSKGEKIIAVFSLTCQHCKSASYKLFIAAEKYKLPPIYVVFKGAKSEEVIARLDSMKDDFFKDSNSYFPYTYFNDERIFKMTKGIFPTILHVKEGEVIHIWQGSTLSYQELENLETTISGN